MKLYLNSSINVRSPLITSATQNLVSLIAQSVSPGIPKPSAGGSFSPAFRNDLINIGNTGDVVNTRGQQRGIQILNLADNTFVPFSVMSASILACPYLLVVRASDTYDVTPMLMAPDPRALFPITNVNGALQRPLVDSDKLQQEEILLRTSLVGLPSAYTQPRTLAQTDGIATVIPLTDSSIVAPAYGGIGIQSSFSQNTFEQPLFFSTLWHDLRPILAGAFTQPSVIPFKPFLDAPSSTFLVMGIKVFTAWALDVPSLTIGRDKPAAGDTYICMPSSSQSNPLTYDPTTNPRVTPFVNDSFDYNGNLQGPSMFGIGSRYLTPLATVELIGNLPTSVFYRTNTLSNGEQTITTRARGRISTVAQPLLEIKN